MEPVLNDPVETMRVISRFHGPERYSNGAAAINGACSLLESSDEFKDACHSRSFDCKPDVGRGVVFGWFVGSPRVFLFGFAKNRSWAVRRMNEAMRREWELATGKVAPRKLPRTIA